MIKKLCGIFKKNILWFMIILALNALFGVLLWLVNTESFIYIFPVMIIGSLILYCFTVFIIYITDKRKNEAVFRFLDDPSISNENELMQLLSGSDKNLFKQIGKVLRSNQNSLREKVMENNEYEEYIESWAHEIKTPLGLMTFLLDNRKDELSPAVYSRLEYSRTRIQENVERMLYYARLKAANTDYFFKELSLKEVCLYVIEEYNVILKEQNIAVVLEIQDYNVVSDKKGVEFIIRQIISNAVKYKDTAQSNPQIIISSKESDKAIILSISDNGIGVKSYDLPFIFEKGFTGEIGEQHKTSTGMGLYLAKQLSENLKIDLEASENHTKGFEISLVFPKI